MSISTNNKYDVIIVGAGLGGLSCALHFAKQGFHVLVLEKQPKVGGYCQNYQRGEYSFDVSLHLLSAMNKGDGLYKLLDHMQVLDKLHVEKRSPMFTSVFPDETFDLPGGEVAASEYLKSRFPRETVGIDRFVSHIKSIVTENGKLFWTGEVDVDNFFPARYFKKTYKDLLHDCFDDPRLHGLLGQLWQSTGLPNSMCSANWAGEVFGSHLLTGNFYLKGGGQRLSQAMAETLREAGSVVRVSSLVKKIRLEGRRATGVELETGEYFSAPIIVCNANPLQTYFSLIGKEHLAAPYIYKLGKMVPSCSLLTLYMGLDCPAKEAGLDRHTLLFNRTYDNLHAYESSMNEDFENSDYVISDYTVTDGTTHPHGRGIAQILEVANGPAWTQISREAYEEKKKRVTETILTKVSKRYPNLRKHISTLELGTPRTMQLATRNPGGSVYGWAQTPDQADNHRFGVASIFKGLYFTGAWSRGGGGGYMGAIVNGRVAFMQAMGREQLTGRETHINTAKTRISTDQLSSPLQETASSSFQKKTYEKTVATDDISILGELKPDAAVRMLSETANAYAAEYSALLQATWPSLKWTNSPHASFFQTRFVFVPFVTVQRGDVLNIEVTFLPKEPGKGEFTHNIFLKKTGKKLANAGGRALIRTP